MQITLSAITKRNETGFCKQIGDIFLGLEIIWFSHNCFIEIGQVEMYSELEISLLILALYQNKVVDPRSCSVHRF